MADELSIRIGICTADQALGQALCRVLEGWAQVVCANLDLALWTSAAQAEPADCALLLLDLDEGDAAFRLAARARERGQGLVLLSQDEGQAIGAYRCHPDAFLCKPLKADKLRQALKRTAHLWQQGLRRLDLPYYRSRIQLPLCQIYYAEAQGRHTILHGTSGPVEINQPLGKVAEQLPEPPFVRCQKSFIVHLGAVRHISGGLLQMNDGQSISISRPLLSQVREQYDSFWHKESEAAACI